MGACACRRWSRPRPNCRRAWRSCAQRSVSSSPQKLQPGAWTPRADVWLSGWDERFSKELGRRGWLGMTIPTEYGGHGASPLDRYVVTEELLAAGRAGGRALGRRPADRPVADAVRHRGAAPAAPARHRRAARSTSASG